MNYDMSLPHERLCFNDWIYDDTDKQTTRKPIYGVEYQYLQNIYKIFIMS